MLPNLRWSGPSAVSCGASAGAIMHSRRRSGRVGRPLNLDVRRGRKTRVHASPIPLSALAATAYAVFTIAGILLLKRVRSFATAMVAVGFAIILLDQLILLASYLRMMDALRNHSGDTLFIVYHRANSLRVVLVGLWIAAVGLVWHALKSVRP